jgi:two-component system, OmpR family, KDP operon response regulator KdpE
MFRCLEVYQRFIKASAGNIMIGDEKRELEVDLVRRIVKVGEKEMELSPKQYDLLRVLVQHAGKVLTHRFLLKELWDELTDAQYLRVYVRQLRQKIEADPERPQFVLTETGIGYRLRAAD